MILKLKKVSGKSVLVNSDYITRVDQNNAGTVSVIYFEGGDALNVSDSVNDIYKHLSSSGSVGSDGVSFSKRLDALEKDIDKRFDSLSITDVSETVKDVYKKIRDVEKKFDAKLGKVKGKEKTFEL